MEGGGGETSILASCLTNGAVFGPESLINRTVIGRGKDSVILSATCTALGDAPVRAVCSSCLLLAWPRWADKRWACRSR